MNHSDHDEGPFSAPPVSRRLGMIHLKSMGNIRKKARESAIQVDRQADVKTEDTNGRVSLSSWRTKKFRSASSSGPSTTSSYLASKDAPPVPVVPSPTQSRTDTNVPRLPPLLLSSKSSPDIPIQPSSVIRRSGSREESLSKRCDRNTLLVPPQPAFLATRSSSTPSTSVASSRSSFLIGTNSSRVSLMSASSSQATDVTSIPTSSASSSSDTRIQLNKLTFPVTEKRLTMRSLGRFFSKIDKPIRVENTVITADHNRTEKAKRDPVDSLDHIEAHRSSPLSPCKDAQVPSFSSHSNSPSASSSSSSGLSMPETPSVIHPATYLTKASTDSSQTVQYRSSKALPPPPTSGYTLPFEDLVDEENNDFLRAVLSFAFSDSEAPVEVNLVKAREQLPVAKVLNIIRPTKESAWSKEDVEESDQSDDEYGDERDAVKSRSTPVAKSSSSRSSTLRPHSALGRRSIGLDTAAKRAMYACTIIKIYPKLAYNSPMDIKVPRSVNLAASLQGHYSSYSHTRSIHIGLARSTIVRRLNTESISVKMEKELEWFMQKYLCQFIAPNEVPLQLARKAVQSNLEALARPPLLQGSENRMALWASRPSFQERCECIVANDKAELPLKDLRLQIGQFLHIAKRPAHPMPLQLSKRCRALAATSSSAKSRTTSRSQSPCSPFNEVDKDTVSLSKQKNRLASPWASPPRGLSVKSSPIVSRSPSPLRFAAPATSAKLQAVANSDDEDEDIPLAKLMNRRRSRAVSENGACQTAYPHIVHRINKQQEDRDLVLKKQRELMLLQEQRRQLEKARERRKTTEHASILSSPTYGAGDALLASRQKSKAMSEVDTSNRNRRSQQSMPPASTNMNKTSQHNLQVTRSTSYSNPSVPNFTSPPPMTARQERPSRSRVHSQASAPSAWSPSSSNRLSAIPPMPRAPSFHGMPTQPLSMSPPMLSPQYVYQPFQQQQPPGSSPYAMMPMTSPPFSNRHSIVMSPSYFTPKPTHSHTLLYSPPHSAPQHRVANKASWL